MAVNVLSKRYRIAVLTFSVCPLKCHVTASARTLFCLNATSGQCFPFQMKRLHLMGQYCIVGYYYYYCYSALGPVWAETRVQSGDWYGSGTLHPGQVLRGNLPLLSPAFF